LNEKRKTVNGEDILWAMENLGFDRYSETLKLYLHKYRESNKTERYTEILGSGPPSTMATNSSYVQYNEHQPGMPGSSSGQQGGYY
jgi:nuclear transcription Y subunit beta